MPPLRDHKEWGGGMADGQWPSLRDRKGPEGIPKGKTEVILDEVDPIRFPFWPSGESGDHTEGPRRLFGYFLAGQKVSHLKEAPFGAKSRFRFRTKNIPLYL